MKRAPSKAGSSQTEPVRKMKLPIFIADAFTVMAFRGNPAAVCLLESVSTQFSRAMPGIPDVWRAHAICKIGDTVLVFTTSTFVLCHVADGHVFRL